MVFVWGGGAVLIGCVHAVCVCSLLGACMQCACVDLGANAEAALLCGRCCIHCWVHV